ncbi:hypothetical protein GCM10010168_72900 [Actinoplanes ianthinogenes]|nr:hypothetical protein GCM10010168_72900 [Actinoplanes ianthinogenes]
MTSSSPAVASGPARPVSASAQRISNPSAVGNTAPITRVKGLRRSSVNSAPAISSQTGTRLTLRVPGGPEVM